MFTQITPLAIQQYIARRPLHGIAVDVPPSIVVTSTI
jgi:hypothetical protein